MVPVGGYDLGQIKGPLELRLTRYGDTFQALDEPYPASVPSGEVAYADGSTCTGSTLCVETGPCRPYQRQLSQY